MNIPDNYDIWNAHDIENERKRARLPVCDNRRCRQQIDGEHYWEIDGDYLCEKCTALRYRKEVNDFIQKTGSLPVCDNRKCRRQIKGDNYWEIGGDILCEKCMNDRYQRYVEDFIEID